MIEKLKLLSLACLIATGLVGSVIGLVWLIDLARIYLTQVQAIGIFTLIITVFIYIGLTSD